MTKSFRELLARLRFVLGAALAIAAVGIAVTLATPPLGLRWVVAAWGAAAVPTAWGLALVQRAGALQAAEIDRRRQAEQAALAADRAKTEFLANMSHEIRTPMNAALGMTELLLEMDLPDDARQRVEVIQSSGEALLTLIDDVLDFAKIEAGKIELTVAGFDLRELIEKTAQILRAQAAGKDLRFTLDVAAEVPRWVSGDANRLRQILLNLGGNAVKFTEQGEVELRVGLTVDKADPPRVGFRVRDTGIGIAPEQRRRIFETFAQADSSAARRSGGSGLGLSISRQLVELMEGEIGVESEHGVGSTFWVEIPMPPAQEPSTVPVPDDTEVRRRRAGASLLVVDDHAANRTVAVSRLEAMGYRATAAASGEEALDLLATQPFDAVLMDCQMPELDGYETTRRLRASEPAGQRVPVIAVTADALPENRQRCLEAGMDDYLAKPFRSAELAQILDRRLFGGDASGAEALRDESPEASAMTALREQGLLRSTIETLLERGDAQLLALRRALDTGNVEAVARLAHGLGGNAAMFGGDELAKLCADLEEAVAMPDSASQPGLSDRHGAIADAWRHFTRHLEEICDAEPDES